jgi:chromosome segregation ATPase
MGKYLNELEHVEQELAELRNHFEQSFAVLDGLAKVQGQFEDLAQTYQKLKQHLEEVKASRGDIAQVQATFNHRFAELEKVIESRWGEVKSELFNVHNELGNADGKVNAEIAAQVSDLKAEGEKRLTVFLEEWASYKQAIQASLDDIEAGLRTQMQAYMNQLSQAGFNDEHFEKQERLEHQLRLALSFIEDMERKLRNVERQMRVMNKWVVIAVLTTALALGLALLAVRII